MASPIIKLKRSAVAGKRPTLANLPLGEIALNTYDGKLFVRQDTSGVGIATTVRTVNPWSENFVSGGEHSIYYDGGKVGIGTDNPTNAALHVEGRNFALGGPGYNSSGESNLYLGDYNAPANNTYDPNIRVGTRDEFQFEIESDYGNGTRSNNVFFASPTSVGLNIYGDSNSPGTIFYYNYSRTAADQYLYFSANSKYLWFDGDTGRLGINRSSGSGWSDTLDVNGSAKVNGDLTVTGLSTFTNNVHIPNGDVGIGTDTNLTAKLTVGNIENTSVTDKGATAFKTLNSTGGVGEAAIYLEEQSGSEGWYLKVNSSGDLQFNDSGVSDRITFQDGGKVGIGSEIPQAKLDVNGTLNVTGVSTLTGNVSFASSALFGDADKILLGDDDDLQIFHDGNSWIRNTNAASNFFVTSALGLQLRVNSSEIALNAVANGATELFYNNAEKLETTSSGINVTGHTETDTLNVSGLTTFTSTVEITPSSDVNALVIDQSNVIGGGATYPHITLKSGGPQTIDFRDSSNGNGLKIAYRTTPNELRVENSEDSTTHFLVDRDDGRVELRYGGSKKFETTADGAIVTGILTASSFYGDGSNLTGITADAAVGVQTSGGYVGSGVTAFSFEGNAVGNVTVPSSGISTININATTALSRTVTNVTPTQDQTDFTVSYQVGFIDVYLNGVLLSGSDFTATNGTLVSISTSLSTTDNVDFIAYEGVSAGVVDGVNRWTSVGSSIYNNNSGNVGIGTEKPNELLEVAGNIKLGSSSGTAEFYTDLPELRIGVDKNNNNSDSDITFYTNNSEKVRIANDGDVGIGTSVPSRQLHIYDASGDAQVRIESVASGTDAKLDLLANSTGVSQIRFGDEASVNVGFIVYTHSDDTLAFRTNGVNNRMLLDSSGNLGIGSAAPGSRLHVFSTEPEVILVERSSNNNSAIEYKNTDGSMYAGLTSNAESWAVDDDNNLGTAPMFCVLRSNGNVGINSSIPGEALDVNGNVKAVDFNSTSDIKLKDKVRKISKPLSKLDKIRGVSFEWKETKQKSMGVVAQEVEKVIPDLVRGDETKTVNYNGLIGLLIECVKEQQIRIDQLEKKLGQL